MKLVRYTLAALALAAAAVLATAAVAEAHPSHGRHHRDGGGCNQYGCWSTPYGSCNQYGCRDAGGCNWMIPGWTGDARLVESCVEQIADYLRFLRDQFDIPEDEETAAP